MRLDKLNSKTNWRLRWRCPSPFIRRPAPHALSRVFWGNCSLRVYRQHIPYSYAHPYSYWYSYVPCELYAMSSYSRFIFLFFFFFLSCACELCDVCVCVDNAGMMLWEGTGRGSGLSTVYRHLCSCMPTRTFFLLHYVVVVLGNIWRWHWVNASTRRTHRIQNNISQNQNQNQKNKELHK